jgi:hypothetical protein
MIRKSIYSRRLVLSILIASTLVDAFESVVGAAYLSMEMKRAADS